MREMRDLCKRLRDKTRLRRTHGLTGWVLHEEHLTEEAADEIDRLRAENEALRGLLAEGIDMGEYTWIPTASIDAALGEQG